MIFYIIIAVALGVLNVFNKMVNVKASEYLGNTNGTLINKTRILSGILVNFDTIIDIPVTPPSKIVFGIKNDSRAYAAITVPTVNIIKEIINCKYLFFVLFINSSSSL